MRFCFEKIQSIQIICLRLLFCLSVLHESIWFGLDPSNHLRFNFERVLSKTSHQFDALDQQQIEMQEENAVE